MANHMVDSTNSVAIVDRRRSTNGPTSATSIATPANYASISAMRSRLTTLNGSYFTAARLDAMTANDMVYALRLADDAASV